MIYFLLAGGALFWTGLALTASAPGIVGGDAPELTSAAFHLGSAHAPGYPLYVALVRIFLQMPLGTPAFRSTFFSILVQGAAFVILAHALKNLPGSRLREGERWGLAFLISCLVMSGPLVFHQFLSPEVFALHFFFIALFLLLVFKKDSLGFLATAFVSGAALTHQHLALLVLPALLWNYRSFLGRPKTLLYGISLFLLGLSVYLLLPLRAVQHPLANWGHPDNFRQFLYHLGRTQYGGDITGGKFMNGLQLLWLYLKDYFREILGLGLPLVLLGLWIGYRRFSVAYWIGFSTQFLLLPFLIRAPNDPENNFVNGAFLTPAILWFSPLLFLGLEWAYEKAGKFRFWATALVALQVLIGAGITFGEKDSSRNLAVEDVGRDIFRQMPRRSVLYSEGDAVTFSLAYLNLVLGLRPDLDLFDRTGGLFKDLYQLLDYRGSPSVTLDYLVGKERAYESIRQPVDIYYSESTYSPGRALTMTGLLFKVTEGNMGLGPMDLWNGFRPPRIERRHDYFSRETGARYFLFKASWDLDQAKNQAYYQADMDRLGELTFDNYRLLVNEGLVESGHGRTDQAVLDYEKAIEITPDASLAWVDLGIVAHKQGRVADAVRYYRKAVALEPYNAVYHIHLGYEYYQNGQAQEAIGEWETTRRIDPSNPEAYHNLGLIYMKTNPEYAAQMIRQFLGIYPGAGDRPALEKWLAAQPAQ